MFNKIEKPRVNYILKKPNPKEKRKGWTILERTLNPGGRVTTVKLENSSLDAISRAFALGTQPEDICQKQAEEIRDRLYELSRGKTVFRGANYEILGEFGNPAPGTYWREVYGRRKHIIDRKTAYADLRRAIEALGNLSIMTATEEQIQAAVEAHEYRDNKQRRIVGKLEAVLEWLGRKEVVLEKRRPEYEDVRFITQKQLPELLGKLDSHLSKMLCGMAFHCGLRQGELFAIEPEHVVAGEVVVLRQMDKTLRKRPVKTRQKARQAVILEGGEEYFTEWFKIPLQERLGARKWDWSKIVRRASRKAFGDDKSITFHDLRHSYAICLMAVPVELAVVAQNLGNSVLVCEKHYSGRVMTSTIAEAVKARMKAYYQALRDEEDLQQQDSSTPQPPRAVVRGK